MIQTVLQKIINHQPIIISELRSEAKRWGVTIDDPRGNPVDPSVIAANLAMAMRSTVLYSYQTAEGLGVDGAFTKGFSFGFDS